MEVISLKTEPKKMYLCDHFSNIGSDVKFEDVISHELAGELGRLAYEEDEKWYWWEYDQPRTYTVGQFDTKVYKEVKVVNKIELIDVRLKQAR